MGFDFLKRGKKPGAPASDAAAPPAPLSEPEPNATASEGLRVYNMGPSQEMRYATELLSSKGLEFETIDVSTDPGLQSWVRQKTGSAEYPQVFLGRKPLGDFGTLRRMDLEGNLDRMLAGLPPLEIDAEIAVETGSSPAAVRARLRRGDVLSLTTPDGETFDAWAEVFANPPQIYYRGEPLPLDSMDRIVDEIATLLADQRTDASWSAGA
jgi:glutaredoxin